MNKIFWVVCISLTPFLSQSSDLLQITDLNTIKALPKTPILTQGCEGECCGVLKSHKALTDIQLYETPKTWQRKPRF